jgi:hypothetical protein
MEIVAQYKAVFRDPDDPLFESEGMAVEFDDGQVVIFLEEGDAVDFEALGDVPPTYTLTPKHPVRYVDPVVTTEQASEAIKLVCTDLMNLLLEKNEKYGNSVLAPSSEIASIPALVGCVSRVQDKIKRLRLGSEYPGDDTLFDLAGYIVLLLAGLRLGLKIPREFSKGWGA